MLRVFAFIGSSVATVSLAIGYALAGRWGGAALIVALGLFWLAGDRWEWRGRLLVTAVSIVLFTGAVVWGRGRGWRQAGCW